MFYANDMMNRWAVLHGIWGVPDYGGGRRTRQLVQYCSGGARAISGASPTSTPVIAQGSWLYLFYSHYIIAASL